MALYRVPTINNAQYTLDSQISAGASALTLNQSVAGIVQAPGVLCIDRIDSSGNITASKREYKTFTGVAGANITGLSGGLAGSTDQVHSVGAIVEFVPDIVQEEAKYQWSIKEHDATNGIHASLVSLTIAKTLDLSVASSASIRKLDVGGDLKVANSINASGASLQGLPIRPVFVVPAIASAASVGIVSMPMPYSGTFDHWSISLPPGAAVSAASLTIDINKNGISIFDTATRPAIMGAGTYASTASILTKAFNAGDVFSIDVDNVGNKVTVTAVGSAR